MDGELHAPPENDNHASTRYKSVFPRAHLFFNTDLIDDLQAAFPGQLMVTGYIDDICILTWGETAAEN
jgi:hypothetical protein